MDTEKADQASSSKNPNSEKSITRKKRVVKKPTKTYNLRGTKPAQTVTRRQ